jgi:hypothetical protein
MSYLKDVKAAHYTSVTNHIKLQDAYLISRGEAKAEANGSTVEIEREKKRQTTERQRDAGRKLS